CLRDWTFRNEVQLILMGYEPPCCSAGEGSCVSNGACKDCTMYFRHADLQNDRPSTTQFKDKLPWFLSSLHSTDCAKGGHGAYTSSVDLKVSAAETLYPHDKPIIQLVSREHEEFLRLVKKK
ncbi:hypothetical protein S245_060790, partial [Arachis hypogaea]